MWTKYTALQPVELVHMDISNESNTEYILAKQTIAFWFEELGKIQNLASSFWTSSGCLQMLFVNLEIFYWIEKNTCKRLREKWTI